MKKLFVYCVGFLAFIILFFVVTKQIQAHDNWKGDCYHAPNQWVSCGTQTVCYGPDLANYWTTCFIDSSGNHTSCGAPVYEVHQANASACVPTTPCDNTCAGSTNPSTSTQSCSYNSSGDAACQAVSGNSYCYRCTSVPPTSTPIPPTNPPVPPTSPPSGPVCYNGICEAGEGCGSCPYDCGSCSTPPACPDGVCNAGESCSSCPQDCGACYTPPTSTSTPPVSTATPTRTPTPSTTPTPPLTCNSPCTTPASCTGAINGCTFCNPTTKRCETPPACNTDCTSDPNICTQAGGGCTVCSPTTKKCVAPPTATPTATSTPKPTATSTPTPTATSTPTPTPLPFSESMCKCDGLDYTSLALGQPATITAYGKVEGIEQSYAKIPSMTFRFYQSSAGSTTATQLESETINTTIDSQTAEKTRYKAVWELTLPSNLDTSQTYRIQAKLNCSRKSAALLPSNSNRVVLAANTSPNPSFWDRIFGFFANLFGGGQQNVVSVTGPTATPTLTSAQQKQLQLKTFTPARGVSTDNCTFIKFNF